MLFNSVEFIFGFLPVTALVFFGIARRSHPARSWGGQTRGRLQVRTRGRWLGVG